MITYLFARAPLNDLCQWVVVFQFLLFRECLFCFFAWRRQADWDRERTNSYKGLTLVGADADIYQSVVFDHHHAFDELA